jgi:hypothetical protein
MNATPNKSAIDFSTFVLSLAGSAMVHLGRVPDPTGQSGQVNLEMARQSIDLLVLMRDKTTGNLTPDEASMLERVLHDVRMAFVEEAKKHAS